MSVDIVKQIIARAVTEPEFRELLLADSAKALEGYELTEDESANLRSLSRENFDVLAGELEERVSRAGIGLPDSPDPNAKLKKLRNSMDEFK